MFQYALWMLLGKRMLLQSRFTHVIPVNYYGTVNTVTLRGDHESNKDSKPISYSSISGFLNI